MRENRPRWVWIVAGALLCAEAMAAGPSPPKSMYEDIVPRNLFALREPPRQEETPPTKKAPPKVTLTGITTILGDKRAILEALRPSDKPGQSTKEGLILAEGQRDGNIEVVHIDEHAEQVKVNDDGELVTLTFEKGGTNSAGGPAAVTSSPTVPGGVPLRQGYRPLPSRIPRLPASPGAAAPAGAAGASTAPAIPSPTGMSSPMPPPPPGMAGSPDASAQTQQQPQQALTPEEEALLEQLEQTAAQQPRSGTTTIGAQPPGAAPGTLPPSAGALPPGLSQQRIKPPLMPQ